VNPLGIRALPSPELGVFNFDDYNNVAVLRYRGAPNQFPPDPSQNVPVIHNPLIETNLHVSGTIIYSHLLIDEVSTFSSV
jgi:hypothetical protein